MTLDDLLAALNGPGPWLGFALGFGARSLLKASLTAYAKYIVRKAKQTPSKADDENARIAADAIEQIAKSVSVIELRGKRPTGQK